MKTTTLMGATVLALGLSIACLCAQDGERRPARGERPPPREEGGPGPGGERRHMPPPPLLAALDANRDGVIDAAEIEQASASLRKLDKNGDGKLTMEELRPAGPGPRGEDEGERKGPPRH